MQFFRLGKSRVRRMSAFGGKADSDQPLLTNLDL